MRPEFCRLVNKFFLAGLTAQLLAVLTAAALAIAIWSSGEKTRATEVAVSILDAHKSSIAESLFVVETLGLKPILEILALRKVVEQTKIQGINGRFEVVECNPDFSRPDRISFRIGERRLSRCVQFHYEGLGWTQVFGLVIGFGFVCLIIAFIAWRFIKGRVLDRIVQPLISRAEESYRLQMLGEVATQMSHDIKSPLAALRTATQDLGPLEGSAKILIEAAIDRLDGIAGDLLKRHRKGQVENTFQVADIIDSLVVEKSLEYRNRRVEFRVEKGASSFRMTNDELGLTRVLSNLINNAVEASVAEPKLIEIGVRKEGSFAEVYICDQGPGFPGPVLQGLRTGVVQSTKENGNALGLRGALSYARAAGGRLEIRPRTGRAGRGTEVVLALPIHG